MEENLKVEENLLLEENLKVEENLLLEENLLVEETAGPFGLFFLLSRGFSTSRGGRVTARPPPQHNTQQYPRRPPPDSPVSRETLSQGWRRRGDYLDG